MEAESSRIVQLGTRNVVFPSQELGQLEDCNKLLGDRDALHKEMEDKGYLFIRGLHDRQEVLNARLAVLEYIKNSGEDKLDLTHAWEEGVLEYRCGKGCIPFMEYCDVVLDMLGALKSLLHWENNPQCTFGFGTEFDINMLNVHVDQDSGHMVEEDLGKNDITHSEVVLKVLEGPRPFQFFKTFFGEEPRTFDFKWLRGIHREAFTGAHVDNVYMSWGTPNLYTLWTPMGDVKPELGTLAVCEGSHKLEAGFKHFQETYGNLDVEKDNLKGTGWFTCDPFEITTKFGGKWKTSEFQAGDALIFNLRTVHMSTANLTNLVRISCDTRWQRASEPADPRYVGDMNIQARPKFGLYGSDEKSSSREITIEELRTKWGLE